MPLTQSLALSSYLLLPNLLAEVVKPVSRVVPVPLARRPWRVPDDALGAHDVHTSAPLVRS